MTDHKRIYPSKIRQDPEVVRKAQERLKAELRERESHRGRGLFWVCYFALVAYLGGHLVAWVMR